MKTLAGCGALRRLLPLSGALLLSFSFVGNIPAYAEENNNPIRMLVLTYGDKEAPGVLTITEQMRTRLEADLHRPVWIFAESFAEVAAGNDPKYESTVLELLQRKYGKQPISLVVPIGIFPIEFAARHQKEFLPQAPRVYLGMGVGPSKALPNSYGYTWKFNFAPVAELALSQNPSAKHLLLIFGQDTLDQSLAKLSLPSVQEGVRHSGRTVTIDFTPDDTFDELRKRLANLPQDVVPIFMGYHGDSAGQSFIPARALTAFAAVANRPIYGETSSYLGRGIVGGSLADLQMMGDEMGKMGVQILRGNLPSPEPQIMPDFQMVAFDWKQMQRFGLRMDQVPRGSKVINREPGVWELYKKYILFAVSVLVLETLLIALLLRQRSKLRQDREEIQELSSRLIHAHDDERAHIARELHDDINQQLAVIAIELQKLDAGLPNPSIRASVKGVWNRTVDVSRELQKLSHDLHSVKLVHLGLVAALKSLANEVASHDQIEVTFESRQVPERLPQEVSLAFFRIAQEALRNASRHGSAKLVNVILALDDGSLTLSIDDHGNGFDISHAVRGLGLMSMQERMRLVHGRFHIQSEPLVGTSIRATVPIETLAQGHLA